MSITGALLGFAIVSILVGVIGAIVSGILWGESDSWQETRPYKMMLGLCVLLLFIGGIIAGGVA